MTLGDRLKKLRADNDLTLEEVSKYVQVSRQTINRYENNIITNIPSDKIELLARIFDTTPAYLMGWEEETPEPPEPKPKGVKIPVLGTVRAGLPMEAIEEVLDYEEIPERMARCGEHFGLLVRGDSMEPKFSQGDVVIVRRQPMVNNGEIGIFLVNGCDATIKKYSKDNHGIDLIPLNDNYPVQHYSKKETEELPVICLGKVVELRAKF